MRGKFDIMLPTTTVERERSSTSMIVSTSTYMSRARERCRYSVPIVLFFV